MRSRYHSCKSSGWKLKYFRHGAESTLLAPIGITRYPFLGKACFCIAPKDTPRRFSQCRMITKLRIKTFSHTKEAFRVPSSCVPKDKSKPLAIRFWRTAGFEPAKRELNRLKGARILLAYTLEHPCAPLWRIISNTGLKVPCKHILPIHIPFFTEKKLRTLIWVRSLAVFLVFRRAILWKNPVLRPEP